MFKKYVQPEFYYCFSVGIFLALAPVVHFEPSLKLLLQISEWLVFFCYWFFVGNKWSTKGYLLFCTSLPWMQLSQFLGVPDEWGMWPKFLSVFDLMRAGRYFWSLELIHPALARLLPVSVVIPLFIHFIAIGWISLRQSSEQLFADRYVDALYWTITTLATVGYGDLTPHTKLEKLYACGVMLIGVGFFGYIVSNIATLLSRLDSAREEHLSKLDRIEAYMRHHEVPLHMKYKVRQFFDYVWKNQRTNYGRELLAPLPKKLRAELALVVNSEIFEKVPLFQNAHSDLIESLALELEPYMSAPQELLFRRGDVGDSMYFIANGVVEILDENQHVKAVLEGGQFFGEGALLNSRPRQATARTRSYCELYRLSQESFHQTLQMHPEFKKQILLTDEERHR